MEGNSDGDRLSASQTALLAGVLFEVVLVFAMLIAPSGSWVAIEAANFLILTHTPLFWFASQVAPGSTLFALLAVLTMVLLWWALFYWSWKLTRWTTVRLGITAGIKRRIKYGLILAGAMLASWVVIEMIDGKSRSFQPSSKIQTAVDDNTAFAVDLYAKLKSQTGNLFFSPYSISSGIALIYAGARGNSQIEVAKAAHLTLLTDELSPAFGQLIARMNALQRWNRITLSAANSIWCEKDYPFIKSYLDVARLNFGAKARLVDFKHDPGAAANRSTHGFRTIRTGESRELRGRANSIRTRAWSCATQFTSKASGRRNSKSAKPKVHHSRWTPITP